MSALAQRGVNEERQRRTRLENKRASDVDISTITGWFDALCAADEGADDERSDLAYAVEGPELDPHSFL